MDLNDEVGKRENHSDRVGAHPLHDDEHLIDVRLVRALVDLALPGYASLPLSPLPTSGSSNPLFRLGNDLFGPTAPTTWRVCDH